MSRERLPQNRFLFLLGGARSGKSDFAVSQAARSAGPITFVATATAGDDDMAARIEHHRADRPAQWGLCEEPIELEGALSGIEPDTTIIVDCLTLWVSNLLLADWAEPAILQDAERVADTLGGRAGSSFVVSNEVGLGVHPGTELGARYRDVLGRVNQIMARRADRSLFFVAGRALDLHDPLDLLG